MTRRLFALLCIALPLLLSSGCSESPPPQSRIPNVRQTEPTLVLAWSIANSGKGPGTTGWDIDQGWPKFIETQVRPAIEWCEASQVKPIILIHHAFGQWGPWMHLDGWDFAKENKVDFLTENFAVEEAWKSITKDYDCYAYVGNVELIDRLKTLPPAELEAVIRRNLQPYVDAGFKGIYVDGAENAIAVDYKGVTPKHNLDASADVLLLKIADEMFPVLTGIEAAPRVFPEFAPLHSRNVIIRDPLFRIRFGGFTPAQEAKFAARNEAERKTRSYTLRHRSAAQLGWPNTDHLKGSIWRTLRHGEDPQITAELASIIAAEGDFAVICPEPFIQQQIKASELFQSTEPAGPLL